MASIALAGVTKRFGDVTAVRDLSLEIPDGEMLVLVGPSGCGKTTLLRLIAGLEQPDGGSVAFDGEDMAGVKPGDRDVAMVFAGYALYPHLAVRDNLAFALRLKHTPAAEVDRRVADVARAMELGELLGRKPTGLAAGEAQHVAVGRTVVRDPPAVLLLDDALAHLDARQRREARVEVLHLQRDLGCTVVSVTHDQEEALAIGHRIAVMSEGQLLQVGPPQELYERPANVFVAGFIGTPAMNLLPMETAREGEQTRLQRGGLEVVAPARWAAGEMRAVTVGIRPDAIRLRPAASPDEAGFAARCDLVEYLGPRLLVHLDIGPAELVALADASEAVVAGDIVKASLRIDRIHLFDTRTGEALVHALPPEAEPAP